MKSIDQEIFELEQRLHLREASLKQTARQAKSRALKALRSPVSIVGAVALGFLVAGRVGRRRANVPAVSQQANAQTKGLALGGLAMAAITWFIKTQFGGPVGLAQFAISKIRHRSERPKALTRELNGVRSTLT